MKPLGLTTTLEVTHPSKVEDAVWDAVEEAINAGWSSKRFKEEAAVAWKERLDQDAKDAVKELSK